MDLIELLSLAGLAQMVPYALIVCAIAAGVVAIFPEPTGRLAGLWKVLNVLALNVRHARNATSTVSTVATATSTVASALRRPAGSVGPPKRPDNTS